MSQLGKDTAGTEQVATADGVGMAISDSTAIRALVNPEAKLGEVASPLKWISFINTFAKMKFLAFFQNKHQYIVCSIFQAYYILCVIFRQTM